MSRISLRTSPQFSRRSVSFLLSAAASGNAMANARTEDISCFNIKSPRSSLGVAILRSEVSGRNPRNIATSSPLRRPVIRGAASETFVLFQLYFPGTQFASRRSSADRLFIYGNTRMRDIGGGLGASGLAWGTENDVSAG